MKIGKNKYWCGWCDLIIEQVVNKSDGKGAVSDQVKCPKCLNYVPQKTRAEMKK